jgi:hypothetical protein
MAGERRVRSMGTAWYMWISLNIWYFYYHSNNGYANGAKYYVLRTLPVLFLIGMKFSFIYNAAQTRSKILYFNPVPQVTIYECIPSTALYVYTILYSTNMAILLLVSAFFGHLHGRIHNLFFVEWFPEDGRKRPKHVEGLPHLCTLLYLIMLQLLGYTTCMMMEHMCTRQSRLLVWWFSATFLWSINDFHSDRIRYRMLSTQVRNKNSLTFWHRNLAFKF